MTDAPFLPPLWRRVSQEFRPYVVGAPASAPAPGGTANLDVPPGYQPGGVAPGVLRRGPGSSTDAAARPAGWKPSVRQTGGLRYAVH